MKVLVVDDDTILLNDIRRYLEEKQYAVFCAQNAKEAKDIVSEMTLDCIILDIDLPDSNGFNLFNVVRQKTCCPIIFLSGYTEEHNRIKGLDIGGADYICKPCSLVELELRIKARIGIENNVHLAKTLQYGPLVISPIEYTITYDGVNVDFSSQEFDVLLFLASHPHTVFTYDQIHAMVWKSPIVKGVKSVQMTIVRIRKKLIEFSPNHDYLQTIRNKGYIFIP